jgi:hypothetical protein
MGHFSPRRLGAYAAVALSLSLVTTPAAAVWEAATGSLSGTASSNRIPGLTPIRLTQYSLQQQAGNEYAYFAFNVGSGRRSLIVLYDLDDPYVKAVHEQLMEAFKSGRGIRWMRNNHDSGYVESSGWQGYSANTIFPIRAGHRIELIIDR